jgi:hypothetical protein
MKRLLEERSRPRHPRSRGTRPRWISAFAEDPFRLRSASDAFAWTEIDFEEDVIKTPEAGARLLLPFRPRRRGGLQT